jgi:hypothetical protein
MGRAGLTAAKRSVNWCKTTQGLLTLTMGISVLPALTRNDPERSRRLRRAEHVSAADRPDRPSASRGLAAGRRERPTACRGHEPSAATTRALRHPGQVRRATYAATVGIRRPIRTTTAPTRTPGAPQPSTGAVCPVITRLPYDTSSRRRLICAINCRHRFVAS